MTAVLLLLDAILAPLASDTYAARRDAQLRLERLPTVALAPLVARGLASPDEEVVVRCRLLAAGVRRSLDPVWILLYSPGRVGDIPPADWFTGQPALCAAVHAEWERQGLEHPGDSATYLTTRNWILEYRANLRGKTAGYVPFRLFDRNLPMYDKSRD